MDPPPIRSLSLSQLRTGGENSENTEPTCSHSTVGYSPIDPAADRGPSIDARRGQLILHKATVKKKDAAGSMDYKCSPEKVH